MNDDSARKREERPRIDASPALGEGGHEAEELGYEEIPDTGPVLDDPAADRHHAGDAEAALDIPATRFPPD
jgi:hypothetical protein